MGLMMGTNRQGNHLQIAFNQEAINQATFFEKSIDSLQTKLNSQRNIVEGELKDKQSRLELANSQLVKAQAELTRLKGMNAEQYSENVVLSSQAEVERLQQEQANLGKEIQRLKEEKVQLAKDYAETQRVAIQGIEATIGGAMERLRVEAGNPFAIFRKAIADIRTTYKNAKGEIKSYYDSLIDAVLLGDQDIIKQMKN